MNNRWIWGIPAILLASALIGAVAVSQRAERKDIVDTAIAAGQFKTLVKLVQEADLVDALRGEGPFTVFAPTDAAFAKLPKAQVDALLKDKEALKQVLLYHVVSCKVMSKDVVKLRSAKTLQGQNVNIRVQNKTVRINDARVVRADIECSNGVIHV
ncbi:MAG: fasciclin domain-containing protein, partial [bacterium]|nr:fasciclin domain-containing protein [bacterium]